MSATTLELNLKFELHIRVFCGFDEFSNEMWNNWPLWEYVREIHNTGTYLEAMDMDDDLAEQLEVLARDHHNLCMVLSEMCNLRPQFALKYIADSEPQMAELNERAKRIFGDRLFLNAA